MSRRADLIFKKSSLDANWKRKMIYPMKSEYGET
jgi:hypothetical protein